MRLILDTNVLLPGLLIPHSQPAQLLEAWERKRFTLVVCEELIAEIRDVSSRPFFKARLRTSAVEELLADLADFSLFIAEARPARFAADPKDAYLLGLAEASNADFLVTGDKALQELNRYKDTRIVSVAAIMRSLKDKGRE